MSQPAVSSSRPVPRSSLLLASVLLAAGCCETYKCTPPNAQLTVRDGTGRSLDSATVSGGDAAVVEKNCPAGAACQHVLRTRADVTLMVTAAGYKPLSLEVRPRIDECGNAVNQDIEVTMVPEDSTNTTFSSFRISSNLTCE